jgi:3'-phosphoadenosine 5'-phosphosulfate sulfotransferase (PAPS reductase)/FAD synthetase
MKHIASVSFGKDSLAMLLLMLEKEYPLDEVIYYNTGVEFQAIYDIRDKVKKMLDEKGIKFTEIKPKYDFMWSAFERPINKRTGGVRYGLSWCGGFCRWHTSEKVNAIKEHYKIYNEPITEYVGIAVDEPERLERAKSKGQITPLADWGMSEADCLAYCKSKGFEWLENNTCLYDILDRVSCWCCANKNRKELKNIYQYLPEYWDKLKDFQSKTDRPMKKFCNKKYGHYGNVFDMEKVFEQELNVSK